MGQPIYSAVDASVVNGGIMTMEASGGGQTETKLWLNWEADSGFTGGLVGWDSLITEISNTGWPDFYITLGGEYDSSHASFLDYLNTDPPDLNGVLGDNVWLTKSSFIDKYWEDLTAGTNRPGNGCLVWA